MSLHRPETPMPKTLGYYEVIDHQLVVSREDEPPLAVVLRRDPYRPADRAYEVCMAALRNGEWAGFDTEHSMSRTQADTRFSERIQERGAA
jgi:hypothetical protein